MLLISMLTVDFVKSGLLSWKKTAIYKIKGFEEIPRTGNPESLDVCGNKHQY